MLIVMNLGTIILPPSKLTEGLTWIAELAAEAS